MFHWVIDVVDVRVGQLKAKDVCPVTNLAGPGYLNHAFQVRGGTRSPGLM